MIRKRTGHTADAEAAQDEAVTAPTAAETGTGVPESPPGDLESPADYAARAAQMTDEAAAGQAFAEERRNQAQALMAAARTEAAAIIGKAEARARELGKEADQREWEIRGLTDRASWLGSAARAQEQAIASAVQAAALAEERERLGTRLDELDGTLDRLRADERDANAQLTAARDSADVKSAEEQQSRLKAIEGVIAAQTAQRNAAQSRFAAIGDGTPNFPGQLADALRATQARHSETRRHLNEVWPDRKEARLDRAMSDLEGAIDGNMQRIAEEAKAKAKAPQRQIVHL